MALGDNLINGSKEKIDQLRKEGINPYPYSFKKTHSSTQLKENYKENEEVQFAGRIIARRVLGKIAFIKLRDEEGDFQLFLSREITKNYSIVEKTDLGDFVGAKGRLSKTKSGEPSIFTEELTVLAKTLRGLPEKYHGIADPELKQRFRYLDLIMNLETRETFKKRHEIIKGIRTYLYKKDFIELETPILQPVYGGANARPFITHHNTLNQDLYLRISVELYLKRLIIGGYEKVFEMGKDFRNEGMDSMHNPEFTMLELYQAYADYNDMMNLTEDMIKFLAKEIFHKEKFMFKGNNIDLTKPFRKLTMNQAIKEYTGYDVEELSTEELKKIIEPLKIELKGEITRGLLINTIFEEIAQEKIIQPTFVLDYPKEVSPLTKLHRENPALTERFELFISGEEFANAYSELNDPADQRERFEAQERNRKKGDEEAPPSDADFLIALEHGMPPAGGLGIGVDRLIMFLTERDSIRDIIPFPLLREEQKSDED
ncbi:MAG: lysyl-tRNA synthetase, class [Candidatus Woesearchaeota archaeon]|nr:lysyl-tRNA synthetase, class [Candidatus Woesearchaeota archaeon]